jgi:septum formation protein
LSLTRLVLASRSPQRRAILEQLGVAFDVVVSDADELETGHAVDVALENARRKAVAVADLITAAFAPHTEAKPAVIGVDTVVALQGALYGKPADAGEARATLERLSGRTHEVVSGIAVVEAGETRTAHTTTRVTFRALDAVTLDWYLATEEWRERAGAYAIQGRGAALVAGIEGDYLNVVGLPVPALLELLPGILHPGT